MIRRRFTDDFDPDTMDLSEAMRMVEEEITNLEGGSMSTAAEESKPTPAKSAKKKSSAKKVTKKAGAKKKSSAKKKVAAPIAANGITIQELAKELKVEPTALRRKIRSMDGLSKKGGHRYAWEKSSPDLKKIRAAYAE